MSVSTRPVLAFVLLVAGTVLGLSGIDLVLPAIPDLPAELGGSEASAQLVIAAYVAGTAIGLILFGSLGARFGRRNCLVAGLAIFAALSALGTLMPNMPSLIGLRLAQGIASAAPAVFAPGIIKALFDEAGAIRAMGLFSSIESIVPAAAPIVGLWLLSLGGWQLSFTLTAALAAGLALVLKVFGGLLPPSAGGSSTGSYWRLIRSPVFLRYCVSQALVVGGLLIFVFGAPAVIVNAMG
ncbi:MAG: multidrug effflux MFS transporter, partial [Alphaproteobacteria bacterium]|nr:multidrug effflux MFS transporter [Alphaproteobacteria bacterium]